ncbi:MAG TPA: AraC family transcriptional regulator [Sphaerochaeta sp.]|nr:AraC family transcriptional regulator [Sphaerochaeta sp.]
MRKKALYLPNSKTFVLFLLVFVICFVVLFFSQNWMLKTVREEKQEQSYAMLRLAKTTTDLSLDQAFKLSQLLLLDNDIAKFIYQGEVDGGSEDIQTIIDAKVSLPVARSISSMLSEIYVFSRNSGYLLSANNAYLEPEKMYPTLFAFKDLNYRQFRSKYLTASFTRSFFAETTALVDGRAMRVIPLVQTFPLNSPSSNSGKIIMLLDSSFFASILAEQRVGENLTSFITDASGKLITHWGEEALIVGTDYADGQHRIQVGKEAYVLSVLSSEVSGLRFFSVLSLKDITAMMSPLWTVLTFLSLAMFLVMAILSLLILLRNRKDWVELFSLASQGESLLPYEQALTHIKAIVAEDRAKVRMAGGTPFITDTFFRRLIHGKMADTSEIQAMLKLVQEDIDFSQHLAYQMVHLVIHDVNDILTSDRLEDIDFTRIAAQKQAQRAFGQHCFLYMDFSFSIWVMLWHQEASYLDAQIDLFWKEFSQVAPTSTSMAVSSSKTSLNEIFDATNECSEVLQSISNEKQVEIVRRYSELTLRRERYHYTTDMERKLYFAVLRGEEEALGDILRLLEQDNFVARSLGSEETANFLRVLYATAIKLGQAMHHEDTPKVFTTYAQAKHYFLSFALGVKGENQNKEEILIQKIVAYIQERYDQCSLNLSSMAKDFAMKESFLYHFMQTRMQTSFAQYLEEYRLTRAATLFSEKQMTITEVTALCGYANSQTFRRAFKKHYGMLPSEYQKTVLYRQGP